MQGKNSEKKQNSGELEKSISPILVVNSPKLKPFIELFEAYPENINLQPLGSMTGFFKINDKSEDSAYIVNFLSSVIKKEYYINPKRPVSESFDGALHKVNLALSEIAKNGNIRWIGQLDSAICVLEKNILHFTVSGTAQILLLRNQMLSNISQDLNPEELEPNPLKTFSNVSSGYLEVGDKIIVTSGELFNLFSLTEIKKGSSRFDSEKFIQFLKTAMINELDLAATIVIDITENAVKLERKKAKEMEKTLNAFDGKTFEKPTILPKDLRPADPNTSDKEYTDEKTGHIYVQGDSQEAPENNFWSNLQVILGEKAVDFSYWSKNIGRKSKINLKRFFILLKNNFLALQKKILQAIQEAKEKRAAEAVLKSIASPSVRIEESFSSKLMPEIVSEKIESRPDKGVSNSFWEKIRTWIEKTDLSSARSKLGKLLPNFSKIKNYFSRWNYQQRLYAILILIAIIGVPLIFSRWNSSKTPIAQETPVAPPSAKEVLLRDSSIREVTLSATPILSPGIEEVITLNDQIFAVSQTKIISLDSTGTVSEFSLPSDFTAIAKITSMEDLNLIFLLSEKGRLISWSPISKKFQENNLVLPANTKVEGLGTYLTYLYVADSTANQIYRYPRAEGGFGSKSDWLKDALSLDNIDDLAIEENLYITKDNQITKLFQGKVQPFNLTQTQTPLIINKLFAGRKLSNLYLLDSQNGRVVKLSKDGAILDQYYNDALLGALDFAVDEKNNKVFFATQEGISSFTMQ